MDNQAKQLANQSQQIDLIQKNLVNTTKILDKLADKTIDTDKNVNNLTNNVNNLTNLMSKFFSNMQNAPDKQVQDQNVQDKPNGEMFS